MFMDAILIIFMLLFSFPIISLIHEYGHVIVAKCLGVQVEKIQIGVGHALTKWEQNNIDVELNWNFFFGGHTFLKDEEAYAKWKRFLIIIAGPIVSIGTYLVIIYVLPLFYIPQNVHMINWLYLFSVISLYMGVVHLIPFRKGINRNNTQGYRTDGSMLLALLFSARKKGRSA